MSDKARADREGTPPVTETDEAEESWLREAVRAPLPTRLPLPGELVGGKYRIEEQLGRGGMGVVFRARHVVSEKPVAIKWMLRPATDEQARRRFDREARAAGRIDHPNVVTLYDVGEEGECSYLVMELLRGESLRDRLRHGAIDARDAIDILVPAMRGVAAAHRAGVVHRDLKPDNIFVCQEREGGQREVKVLDFGVSSITSIEAADSTLTQEGTLLGSLAYMSPEQLRNPHDVDARTDVYAFGVILYELLTGELPFQGVNPSALIVAIATTQPKRLSQALTSFPPGLEEVVLRALARDREERYPGMNSLIDALLPFSAPVRPSADPQAAGAVSPRASAPEWNPRDAGRANASVVHAAPTTTAGGNKAPGRTLSKRSVAWIAVALLGVLALWALIGQLRDVDARVAEPVSTPVLAPTAPPAALPEPVRTEPAPVEPPPAPAPVVASPSPSASSVVNEPRKVAPVRRPRPASAARKASVSTPVAIDPNEDALFPGRK